MSQLVPINFHGDTLEATQTPDGQVWVSLRRCCENLGLSMQGQLKKMKGKPWGCVNEMLMQMPGDDQARPHAMVPLRTLPGWLFSIDARKVKEEIREKLARYQNEAAEVLANHFFGPPAGHHMPTGAIMELVRGVVTEVAKELVPRLVAETVRASLPAAGSNPTLPRYTVAERCRFMGWFNTTRRQRKTIQRLAAWLLELRHGETADLLGGTCVFHGHQVACVDDAITRTRKGYEERDDDGMFTGAA